jgi:hypothetical protein
MPPWKPWYDANLGDYVQSNYNVATHLFDPLTGTAFRQSFWACANENALRDKINGLLNLGIPNHVRVGFFDVEAADQGCKFFAPPIDTAGDDFYIMILPSVPRRSNAPEYINDQAMEDAWFHAVVDGYGM